MSDISATSDSAGISYQAGGPELARENLIEMAELYEADFVDPPLKGMDFYTARRFMERMSGQYLEGPKFKVVLASEDTRLIGFIFGCALPGGTPWWNNLAENMGDLAKEDGGRTFAIIDMIVARSHRGRKIGSSLHGQLLQGRAEERITLLSSPPQQPAYDMWLHWGYEIVGKFKPEPDANLLTAFLRPMPRSEE